VRVERELDSEWGEVESKQQSSECVRDEGNYRELRVNVQEVGELVSRCACRNDDHQWEVAAKAGTDRKVGCRRSPANQAGLPVVPVNIRQNYGIDSIEIS
jgi:hypothetical protein